MAVIVAAYVASAAAVYYALGDHTFLFRMLRPPTWVGLLYIGPASAVLMLIGYRLTARSASGAPIRGFKPGWAAAIRSARCGAFAPARLRFALVVFAVTPIFFNAFSAWKVLIPRLHAFALDPMLSHIDAVLHHGAPYRLLSWVPVAPLDAAYYVWIVFLGLSVAVLAWRGESRILFALLVSLVLLGTVVATLMASAGPPYFHAVTGGHVYDPLQEHLARSAFGPPVALSIQQGLWSIYQSGAAAAGGGISAFPSIHVAVPALLTFASWSRSHRVSLVIGAYALTIEIGSVALGWHYAIDGYASIIATALIWYCVRRLPIPSRFESRRDTAGQTAIGGST